MTTKKLHIKTYGCQMRVCRLFLITCCLIGIWILPAMARPVFAWHSDGLRQEADVIVIATCQSSGDAKNWDYPNPKEDTWVAVDSIFSVQAVIKGELQAKNLTLRHYRYYDRKAEISAIDGPNFVEFNVQKPKQYLMFLQASKDGDYFEPLTGQYDPYGSFKWLQDYHISNERLQ